MGRAQTPCAGPLSFPIFELRIFIKEFAAKEKLSCHRQIRLRRKIVKEPEKYRFEPYFVKTEKKNFHKIVSQERLLVAPCA